MTSSSRIQYAFLHRNVHEGHPHLIEISSRANTSLEDLRFCQDHTLCPRKEMFPMLKWLKYPSIFDDNDRNEVLSKMCSLTITGEDRYFTKEEYFKISINVMINNKIRLNLKVNKKTWTRLDAEKHAQTSKKSLQKRMHRWNDSSSIVFDFRSEYQRSVNEHAHENMK